GLEQAQPELLRRADLQDARLREARQGDVGKRALARASVPGRDRARRAPLRPARRLGTLRAESRRRERHGEVPARDERTPLRRRLAIDAADLRRQRGVTPQPVARFFDSWSGSGQNRHPERRFDPRRLRPGGLGKDLRVRYLVEWTGGYGIPRALLP